MPKPACVYIVLLINYVFTVTTFYEVYDCMSNDSSACWCQSIHPQVGGTSNNAGSGSTGLNAKNWRSYITLPPRSSMYRQSFARSVVFTSTTRVLPFVYMLQCIIGISMHAVSVKLYVGQLHKFRVHVTIHTCTHAHAWHMCMHALKLFWISAH